MTPETPKENQQEPTAPKVVLGLTIIIDENGRRAIAYTSDVTDKDKIQLSKVRELLQWALTNIQDNITLGMVKMELDRKARAIVKPGFRPSKVLEFFNGK